MVRQSCLAERKPWRSDVSKLAGDLAQGIISVIINQNQDRHIENQALFIHQGIINQGTAMSNKPSFFRQLAHNFVLRSDMFAANPILRHSGEPSYETTLGGCLSIILVVTFIAIFYTSFLNVLTKVEVTAINDVEDDPFSSHTITNLEFAIGIDGVDMTAAQRYFGVFLEAIKIENGVSVVQQISLSSCNQSQWSSYGDLVSKLFTAYDMGLMLCPTSRESLILQGFEASGVWKVLQLRVQQCSNATAVDYTCHSQADIDTFFDAETNLNDFFKVEFFILDTEISPTHTQYLTRVIEREIFVSFSHNIGARGIVRMGHYDVTTDSSILPFSVNKKQSGHYVQSFDTHAVQLYSTHYVKIIIEKSRKAIAISRAHQKFDDMLAYVGGLFALIFGWIYFCIGSYSEGKYEFSVAERVFSADSKGDSVKQSSFGFLTYLQFSLYDWLKTFNINLDWPKMEQINEVKEEINEQMDVRYLMKQLQHFESVNKLLLEEHRVVASLLMKQPTLPEVRTLRKVSQLYDKMMASLQEDRMKQSNRTLPKDLKRVHNEFLQTEIEEQDFDSEDQEALQIAMAAFRQVERRRDTIIDCIPPSIVSKLRQRAEKKNGKGLDLNKLGIKEMGSEGHIQGDISFVESIP